MSSNSLWNPFMFSVFRDPRTFKNDTPANPAPKVKSGYKERQSKRKSGTPAPQNYSVADDLKMGLGLMPETEDYRARTNRTLARIASNKKPEKRTVADNMKIARAAAASAAPVAPVAPEVSSLAPETSLRPQGRPSSLAPETSPRPRGRPTPTGPSPSYATMDMGEAGRGANLGMVTPTGPVFPQGADTETFPTVGTTVPLDEILTPGEIAAREFQREIDSRGPQVPFLTAQDQYMNPNLGVSSYDDGPMLAEQAINNMPPLSYTYGEDYTPTGAELLAQLAANGQTDLRNNGNGATYDGTGLNPDTIDGLNTAVTNFGDRVIPGELAARGPVPNTGSRGSESLNIQAVPDPVSVSSGQATNPRLGYESGQDVLQASPDYLTGLDGFGPNTVGQVDDTYYGGGAGTVSPSAAVQTIQNENPDPFGGKAFYDKYINDPFRAATSTLSQDASATIDGLANSFDQASYDAAVRATKDGYAQTPSSFSAYGGSPVFSLFNPRAKTELEAAPSNFTGARDATTGAVNYFDALGETEYDKITAEGRDAMEQSRSQASFQDLLQGEYNPVGEASARGVALNTFGEIASYGPEVLASVFGGAPGIAAVATQGFGESAGGLSQEVDAYIAALDQAGELSTAPNYNAAVSSYTKMFMENGVDPALAQAQARSEAKAQIAFEAKKNMNKVGMVGAVADVLFTGLASPFAKAGIKTLATAGPLKSTAINTGRTAAGSTYGAINEGSSEMVEQGGTNYGIKDALNPNYSLGTNVGGAFLEAAAAGSVKPGADRAAKNLQLAKDNVFNTAPGISSAIPNQGMNPADQAPYGGMDTSGIKPGFAPRRQPNAAGPAQTIDGTINVAQPQGPNPNQGLASIAYNPALNPNAGSLATSSGVTTAYDDSQDPRGPDQRNTPVDAFTTSLDTMGAAEIIKNEIETTGGLSNDVAIKLSEATGLEMVDIEAIAKTIVPGIVVDPNLMDEKRFNPGAEGTRTAFGGSNIKVTQNADGSKTLTNVTTGDPNHVARVEKGENVSDAVAKFDEITTGNSTGSATVDTNAIKVNSEGIASLATDGTKILKPDENGRLMDRGNPFTGVQQGTTYVDGIAVPSTGTDLAVANTASTDVAVDTAAAAEAAAAAAAETGTDVTVANPVDLTEDTTVNADGTTDVVIDGNTDLTTDTNTDLTTDTNTDLTTDTNLNTDLDTVVEVDDALEGVFTVDTKKVPLTDQTDTKKTDTVKSVPIDTGVLVNKAISFDPPEPEEEDTIVEIDDPVVSVPDAPIEPPLPTMETNSRGETVYSCAEPFVLSYNGNGDPICALTKTTTKKMGRKRNRFGGAYGSGLASTNRVGRSQLRGVQKSTTKEYSDPISTRS